ncbi:MAG: hypothetical protein WC539_02500 [Nitrospirota bacterium]
MNRLKKLAALLVTLLFCSFANAADFQQRIDLEKRSNKEGIGQKEVTLLERVPGPGKEAVSKALLDQFKKAKTPITTAGKIERKTRRNHVSIVGAGWFLDVSNDGSGVRYRNYGYLENKKENGLPVSSRLSQERLETLGRQFVKANLSRYIQLDKGEDLVPSFTEYAIGGVAEAKEGISKPEEKVYANTVVFTRTINNVSIVGPGSKIAIMFDNEGTPFGFDFDWPKYKQVSKIQKVLPLEGIKSRAKKLTTVPLDSPNVIVKRFECGLFDAGARKHNRQSVVQSACLVSYSEKKMVNQKAHERDRNSGHLLSSHIDFIPAGEEVILDEKWPQTLKLLNKEQKRDLAAPLAGPRKK